MGEPTRYIVAVSGGVDSVVLLHKLVKDTKAELIIAHFDHGIRPDSAEDRKFVQKLAKNYGLSFEYDEGGLGPKASEAKARQARYKFLNSVKHKYQATAIITAHHQDDVIETAIINLLRGTKRRGLSSLTSQPGLKRPLLNVTKPEIEKYANKHNLKWREDPSNQDTKYLRNYVRLILIPKLDQTDPSWREKFLNRISKASHLNQSIEPLLDQVFMNSATKIKHGYKINRPDIINLPGEVGRELFRRILSADKFKLNINQALIKRTWLFAKTARLGASLQLGKNTELFIQSQDVLVLAKAPR